MYMCSLDVVVVFLFHSICRHVHFHKKNKKIKNKKHVHVHVHA